MLTEEEFFDKLFNEDEFTDDDMKSYIDMLDCNKLYSSNRLLVQILIEFGYNINVIKYAFDKTDKNILMNSHDNLGLTFLESMAFRADIEIFKFICDNLPIKKDDLFFFYCFNLEKIKYLNKNNIVDLSSTSKQNNTLLHNDNQIGNMTLSKFKYLCDIIDVDSINNNNQNILNKICSYSQMVKHYNIEYIQLLLIKTKNMNVKNNDDKYWYDYLNKDTIKQIFTNDFINNDIILKQIDKIIKHIQFDSIYIYKIAFEQNHENIKYIPLKYHDEIIEGMEIDL